MEADFSGAVREKKVNFQQKKVRASMKKNRKMMRSVKICRKK